MKTLQASDPRLTAEKAFEAGKADYQAAKDAAAYVRENIGEMDEMQERSLIGLILSIRYRGRIARGELDPCS